MDETTLDQKMVAQCIAGASPSWRRLVDDNINLVYNAAYNTITKYTNYFDRSDIDDICQIVFMNLFVGNCRVLKMYNPEKAKFSTWLTIITRNATIDYIRKKKTTAVPLEDVEELLYSPQSVEPDIIDIPQDVLTSRQHLVLRMMYDDNLDVVEIAFFLGVKRQTVRSLHHRALKKIREYYGLKTPTAKRKNAVINE